MSTAKMMGKKPTAGEMKFATQTLFNGKEPRYATWVTKRKRDKVQDRLVFLGEYRVFSLKKTLTGTKQIRRCGHLFDLREINTSDVDRVVLKFTSFDLDVQAPNAGIELVRQVRLRLQVLTAGYPVKAMPKILVTPTERGIETLPDYDYGPAAGLIECYLGWCDYYSSPPNSSFVKFVEDTAATESARIAESGGGAAAAAAEEGGIAVNDGPVLAMDQCPNINPRLATKKMLVDLLPVRAALRYNTFFTTLRMEDVPRRDWVAAVADTAGCNATLQTLLMRQVGGAEKDFVALGQNLRANEAAAVTELDVSQNEVKEKGCAALAEWLSKSAVNLQRLSMAQVGAGAKGISSIMTALAGAGHALAELDVSRNACGPTGTQQLCSYFSQPACVQGLQLLYASSCRLDVGSVARALKTGEATNTLTELDLSNNATTSSTIGALVSFVQACSVLKVLNLSKCGLNPATALAVGSAVAANSTLTNVTLDLSRNELPKSGADNIASLIANGANLYALLCSDCKFPKDGMSTIFDALKSNTTLAVLDLSLNLTAGNQVKMVRAMQKLAEALDGHPSLLFLGMAGDRDKRAIGRDLEDVCAVLKRNPVLRELDISGNKAGDSCLITLFDALPDNTHLRSIRYDGNNSTAHAWQALDRALAENSTLIHAPTPKDDLDKGLSALSNKAAKEDYRTKTREIMDSIRMQLRANSAAAASDAVGDDVPGSVLVSALGQRSKQLRSYSVYDFKAAPSTAEAVAKARQSGLLDRASMAADEAPTEGSAQPDKSKPSKSKSKGSADSGGGGGGGGAELDADAVAMAAAAYDPDAAATGAYAAEDDAPATGGGLRGVRDARGSIMGGVTLPPPEALGLPPGLVVPKDPEDDDASKSKPAAGGLGASGAVDVDDLKAHSESGGPPPYTDIPDMDAPNPADAGGGGGGGGDGDDDDDDDWGNGGGSYYNDADDDDDDVHAPPPPAPPPPPGPGASSSGKGGSAAAAAGGGDDDWDDDDGGYHNDAAGDDDDWDDDDAGAGAGAPPAPPPPPGFNSGIDRDKEYVVDDDDGWDEDGDDDHGAGDGDAGSGGGEGGAPAPPPPPPF